MTGRTLDLGCGSAKTPGALGVDRWPAPGVDLLADMASGYLPFADETLDAVVMNDALEHVSDPPRLVGEIARILVPGGTLAVRVPHYTSIHAWSDFTHKSFFSVESLKHLTGGHAAYRHYSATPMELVSSRLHFWKGWRLLGVEALANAFPSLYEKYFAFTFPAMALTFTLRKGAADDAD
ncbi:MAG: class I SAM-dependent methyltransferase [Nitrospinae bacterium]|nr:class I SAM-dependent methyltransferase [Nitrospinota bacterium]